MLIEFAQWWTAQMAELLPGGLSAPRAGAANALVVDAGAPDGKLGVLLRRRHRDSPIATTEPEGAPLRAAIAAFGTPRTVLLRPPPSCVLRQQIVLPATAEQDLERVLTFELSRITPFQPDDLFWSWEIGGRNRARNTLEVLLSLVPKSMLQVPLAAIGDAGLTVSSLEVGPEMERRLIPVGAAHDAGGWGRRATRWLAWTCACLAVVVIALPFVLQSLALSRIADAIEALRPRVAEAAALRQRIEAEGAEKDTVAQEQRNNGDPMTILAVVTRILPDDTFLTDLGLRQRQLTLQGQSDAAARLISRLAADPMIRNPSFAAPVTRSAATNKDVFSIHAEVAP